MMDRYLGVPILLSLKAVQALVKPRPTKTPIPVNKILMIKLWGIGNLVMILPLIRAVRNHYPDASLHFLTLKGNEALLKNTPHLDGLITLDPQGIIKTGFGLLRVAAALRRLRPDLVLDFEQFLRVSPILGSLSGAKQIIGFKTEGQARAALYNVKVPYRRNRHMSLSFGDIVRSSGVNTEGFPPLEVPRSAPAALRVDNLLKTFPKGKSPMVALHLGSGDNFPGRRWPVEHFADLAAMLNKETGACCVLTGTAQEKELGIRCESLGSVPFINTMGALNIMEFIEFLARVDLLVTNDTAPAHIGSALGIPLIAFYGPNTPDLYGPLHMESRSFYKRLPCSPCLTNLNEKTSRCRIPSCILGIEPGEVFQAARDLLGARAPVKSNAPRGGVP